VTHSRTPADRLSCIGTLLAQRGRYGVVTAVSRQYGVARQTLYRWLARAEAVLTAAFAPPAAVETPAGPGLARAILTVWAEGHAGIRALQRCLVETRGVRVRLEVIGAVLRDAAARALAWWTSQAPVHPVVLALDEIFGADHRAAYLNAVDARTGVVSAAVGPVAPDAESWTLVLWDLNDRGVRWTATVHDGGAAAGSAVRAADPAGVPIRDLWHVLARCAAAQDALDRVVAAETKRLARAARFATPAAGPRPRGPRPVHDAIAQATRLAHAARTAAAVRYLTTEWRWALAVGEWRNGRLLDAATRRTELTTVLALLTEVETAALAEQQPVIATLRAHLSEALDGLLAWAVALDPVQTTWGDALGRERTLLVAWAWAQRADLGWTTNQLLAGLPPDWRPAARVLLTAWDGVVRTSSLVESWHAELRPHLAVHRTLSPGMLALLAVRYNLLVATRGLHRGTSPWQRAGWLDAPTDWLTALGFPPADATVRRLVPLKPREAAMAA
jgi:transposase-like protein